ncbi:MAG: hypothetical protein K0R15_571 [Clostridiales bacterium]|jgi:hypothetical protein|nr:hypothetical protein [Clostridiales bacterium]
MRIYWLLILYVELIVKGLKIFLINLIGIVW